MKTALITGSEGQLGRAFVSRLQSLDYQVIGFDKAKQVNQEISMEKQYLSQIEKIFF